jgi:epsin
MRQSGRFLEIRRPSVLGSAQCVRQPVVWLGRVFVETKSRAIQRAFGKKVLLLHTSEGTMLDKVNWTDVKRKGVRQRGKLVSWLKDAVMTDIENKVRAATSVEPYGPTQRELAEIASATHNAEEYPLIMGIIWSRLNDRGRYWRRVYKALDLLRYLMLHGSPRVLEEARAALPHLDVLQGFRYFDQAERRDCGMSVRQKAKVVVEIIRDPRRYEEELQRSLTMMQKMNASVGSSPLYSGSGSAAPAAMSFDAGGYRGGVSGSHSFAGAGSSAPWAASAYTGAPDASFRGFGSDDADAVPESALKLDGGLASERHFATASRGPSKVDDLLGFDESDHGTMSSTEGPRFKSSHADDAALENGAQGTRNDWGEFVAASSSTAAEPGRSTAYHSRPLVGKDGGSSRLDAGDDEFFQNIQSSVVRTKPGASSSDRQGREALVTSSSAASSTERSSVPATSTHALNARETTSVQGSDGKALLEDLLSGSLSTGTAKNSATNGERDASGKQTSPKVRMTPGAARTGSVINGPSAEKTVNDPFSKLLTEMSLKDTEQRASKSGTFTR